MSVREGERYNQKLEMSVQKRHSDSNSDKWLWQVTGYYVNVQKYKMLQSTKCYKVKKCYKVLNVKKC